MKYVEYNTKVKNRSCSLFLLCVCLVVFLLCVCVGSCLPCYY